MVIFNHFYKINIRKHLQRKNDPLELIMIIGITNMGQVVTPEEAPRVK